MKRENHNRSPVSDAYLESHPGDEPVGAQETPRLDSPRRVRLHFHSKRKRLADPDGLSAKAVIDGLVRAGILRNDSANEIESVTFSQEKTKGDEITEVTIEEV